MAKDLFINACILIAAISMGNLLFHVPKIGTRRDKIIIGIIQGFLGIILMLFSVRINGTILIDFRNIAIIISSFLGGATASIVTGLIIGSFRVIYFSLSFSSIVALITVIIVSIGCGIISSSKVVKWKKWSLLTLFCLVLSTISLFIQMSDKVLLQNLLLYYWISTGLMSLIMYFYADRLITLNILFHNFKTASVIDFLTGLNNVRQFDKIFNRAILDAQKKNTCLSLIYLDIDFFKKINDTYGHSEGDAILKQFGEIIRNNCRSIDYIFRKGGDEFAVLLFNTNSEKSIEIAQRIRCAVEAYSFQLNSGLTINLTTSIGVASFPENVTEVDMLSQMADDALYKSKNLGRNRVEVP